MSASERRVADVLDRLGVAWEYEPHLFVLQQTSDGRVLEGFRPDFYLPELKRYLEVTIMKQGNTTTKNRKAREVRATGVRVDLIYKRDFPRLAERVQEILSA